MNITKKGQITFETLVCIALFVSVLYIMLSINVDNLEKIKDNSIQISLKIDALELATKRNMICVNGISTNVEYPAKGRIIGNELVLNEKKTSANATVFCKDSSFRRWFR